MCGLSLRVQQEPSVPMHIVAFSDRFLAPAEGKSDACSEQHHGRVGDEAEVHKQQESDDSVVISEENFDVIWNPKPRKKKFDLK